MYAIDTNVLGGCWPQVTAGFADCLIAERHLSLGAQATLTFDKQAAKRAGMRLLPAI